MPRANGLERSTMFMGFSQYGPIRFRWINASSSFVGWINNQSQVCPWVN